MLRHSSERLTGRIAVSPAAERFISQYFPSDYQIIPNGVDLHRFSAQAEPLPQFTDGKLNLLYLGCIEPRNGLKYLLHALPHIRARFPLTHLIIASDGKERTHYERLVQRHGWPDVVFTGFVPDAHLPRYYASCDLFYAPSTGSESQGVVLLEAMASGKPVIASNIEGYRDVVGPGGAGRWCPRVRVAPWLGRSAGCWQTRPCAEPWAGWGGNMLECSPGPVSRAASWTIIRCCLNSRRIR